jgi:hypothetical protein
MAVFCGHSIGSRQKAVLQNQPLSASDGMGFYPALWHLVSKIFRFERQMVAYFQKPPKLTYANNHAKVRRIYDPGL